VLTTRRRPGPGTPASVTKQASANGEALRAADSLASAATVSARLWTLELAELCSADAPALGALGLWSAGLDADFLRTGVVAVRGGLKPSICPYAEIPPVWRGL